MRIHALPGLGADHRLFPDCWNRLPGFIAHDWPRWGGEQSLEDMAERVAREFGIMDGDVMVGASLGGMVACEVARIRRITRVYLVGSAVHPDEVSRLLKWVHPLIDHMPLQGIRALAGCVPLLVLQMYARNEPAFLRSMSKAVFRWSGAASICCRVVRIHGYLDPIIPRHRGTALKAGMGHLVSLRAAEKCVEFIERDLGGEGVRSVSVFL